MRTPLRPVPKELKKLNKKKMILRKDKKRDEIKMQLWLDVYKGVASLWNANDREAPKNWANRAIKHFEETFEK